MKRCRICHVTSRRSSTTMLVYGVCGPCLTRPVAELRQECVDRDETLEIHRYLNRTVLWLVCGQAAKQADSMGRLDADLEGMA